MGGVTATVNRQVLIASLPTGALSPTDFDIRSAPVPEPAEGEVLCRTIAITIGAASAPGSRAARATPGHRRPAG